MKQLRVVALALALVGALALVVGVGIAHRRARQLQLLCTLDVGEGIEAVAFSPDGRLLAVAGGGMCHLLRAATGARAWSVDLHSALTDRGETLSFASDGGTLAVATTGSVRLLSVRDRGAVSEPVRVARTGVVASVSLPGQVFAAGEASNVVHFLSLTDRRQRSCAQSPDPSSTAEEVSISPRGDAAAIRWSDSVFVGSIAEGKLLWKQAIPDRCYKRVRFSPSGNLVAFWVSSGLRVVSGRDGSEIRTLPQPARNFFDDFAFASDDDLLATSCELDGPGGPSHVRLWSLRDGRCVGSLDLPPEESVSNLAFCPDGATLAIAINHETSSGKVLIYATPR